MYTGREGATGDAGAAGDAEAMGDMKEVCDEDFCVGSLADGAVELDIKRAGRANPTGV